MSPAARRALGTSLIWIGVLAWAPFLYLLATRQPVSIYPFLAFHLAGVLSGAAVRRSARAAGPQTPALEAAEAAAASPAGRRRGVIGRLMILLGVLAWAPYFYLHSFQGQAVTIGPYLAVHLTGVLGGSLVLASVPVGQWLRRRVE